MARTRGELLEFLGERIGFLERSNTAFDAGHLSEAKQMATSLRVLFHHRPQSKSHALINQLGLENTLTGPALPIGGIARSPRPTNKRTPWLGKVPGQPPCGTA